jgi:16S rRNA (guanine527-N7)-methyltransferase
MKFALLASLAQTLFNINLTTDQQEAFSRYGDELIDWNKTRANLTGITDPLAIEIKHMLDSLSVLTAVTLPEGARVIDVGSGGGFPGLPMKIALPDLHLTLLEATGKKVAFLAHMAKLLNLEHVTTIHLRAEEAGQDARYRAQFDLVVARAVARLPALLEYLLPLCKVGGQCVAMKGETAQDEADDSANALKQLGGQLSGLHAVQLPGLMEKHYLVVVTKVAPTPAQYPRRAGLPSQSPL